MGLQTFLQEIWSNWTLVYLFSCFAIIGVWVFWPGKRAKRSEPADIVFRNDTIGDDGCDKNCENCACKGQDLMEVRP